MMPLAIRGIMPPDAAATWVNYQLSIRHVFRSGVRFKRGREILLVYVVSAIDLLINQAVLYVLVDRVGAELMLAKFTATVTVFLWNYYTRKDYVFAEPSLLSR
jgi:putative flippase GtrA